MRSSADADWDQQFKGVVEMKKVLMILLVAVLVIGLVPLTSSAAPLGFTDGADILNNDKIGDFGNIVLGTGDNTLKIPIIPWGGLAASDIDEDTMNEMHLEFTNGDTEKLFYVEKNHWTPDEDAHYLLTPKGIGTASGFVYVTWGRRAPIPESEYYRISGVFIDPTINKTITAIRDNRETYPESGIFIDNRLDSEEVTLDGKKISQTELESLEIRPGAELRFTINSDFFEWDPDITDMKTSVRKSTLVNDKITVVKQVIKGEPLIDTVDFENINGRAYVIVRFVDEVPTITDREFNFEVMLAKSGKRNLITSVSIVGTLSNEVFYVDGEDYVYLGDGTIAEAVGYSPKVELDLGNDVSVYRDLFDGTKYYGVATDERDDDDMEIMDYYVSIKKAITLKTVNVQKSGNIVKIDTGANNYYAYNANGQFLGMTAELLPFSSKYYLSAELIDFTGTGAGEMGDEVEGEYDFDEATEWNAYDNPSTGCGGR